MREVVGMASRRLEGPRRCTTQPPQTTGASDFKPGYLELSPEALARLVSTDPIEKDYDVETEPFARGKYATVRRCRHRVNGLQFAAKYLKKRRRSTDLRYEILHEIAVLEACAPCGRIVNLYQVFETATEMILLLELAPGGELQALLDRDEVPDEVTARRFMREIMGAIEYLHSLNVAHLDIKPQNLVLTGEYPDCDVKLCDFGISRYVGENDDIREILGTPDYVAPEVLNYEAISLATDMWSIGVLLYVLLTGCSPFGGDTKQETFCNISKGDLEFPDDLFEGISETAKDLMRRLMVKDPRTRLTARECIEHEWFDADPVTPTTPTPDCPTLEVEDRKPLSRAPSLRINVGLEIKVEEDKSLRAFRTMVGHEQNINRAAALVRKSSLRRSADHNNLVEVKKAAASNTVPVHIFLARNKFETVQARPAAVVETSPPPRVELPSPRNVFIETPPRVFLPAQPRPATEDLPSVTSSETSSITSDSISEMSVDSSGDCSSVMSSEDSLDWEPGWIKECNGSVARAFSKFNVAPNSRLASRRSLCMSTPSLNNIPDNRTLGLRLVKEQNGNEVVIREIKEGRISRFNVVKCESVRSRIQKLQARC